MSTQKYKELNAETFQFLKSEIQRAGFLDIALSGDSMMPLFKNIKGQRIRVEPIHDISEIQKFDVITFWQNDILVTHYFWRKNEFFTGDESDPVLMTRPLNPIKGYDTPIKYSQILGRVTEKKIGLWLKMKIYLLGRRR